MTWEPDLDGLPPVERALHRAVGGLLPSLARAVRRSPTPQAVAGEMELPDTDARARLEVTGHGIRAERFGKRAALRLDFTADIAAPGRHRTARGHCVLDQATRAILDYRIALSAPLTLATG